ncbi:hypothetical protein [Bacillus sp. JJ722]|uniref:hypothetical protein n=1 Tax=Bacillus sp. JJ722 TaxID=3122973 RepID=UPI002FFFE5EA
MTNIIQFPTIKKVNPIHIKWDVEALKNNYLSHDLMYMNAFESIENEDMFFGFEEGTSQNKN